MASVLISAVAFVSFAVGSVSGQAYTFPDNTTFWVNETQYLIYFSGTREWLAGTGEPQLATVDFQDASRAGESVAVHYAWHQKVISERGTKTIAVYQSTTGKAVYAHVGTSPRVGHVTVDWLSNNVYWTDPGFGWIGLQALKKNMSRFAVNARLKVVVSSSLESPYGVAVLPQIKRLFWSDPGSTPKLEHSDLLGRGRRVMVWQGLARPTALCADHATRLLYWVDEAKGTVESCDEEGQGRRIVTALEGSSLGGLQVFEDYLIVSDRSRNELQAYSKETGRLAASPISGAVNAGDLAVFSSALQPRDNVMCNSTSCDHICIHEGGCVCASGYVVAEDGRTCTERATALWKSFLVSTRTRVCAVPVNLLFSHPHLQPDHIRDTILCFVDDAPDDVNFLAVDSLNATLYYNAGRRVHRFQIHTGNDTVVVPHAYGDIMGMAYDWRSGTLVWTQQSPTSVINGLSQGDTDPVAVYPNLNKPSHITVDSYRGSLFWIESPDGVSSPQIWSGTVDGSQKKVSVLSTGLTTPRHLTYDHKTNRLYWLDVDKVGEISPDGTNRHVIALTSLSTYRGLTVFRSYVIWSTKDTGDSQMTFRNAEFTEADDLITFDLSSKIDDVTDIVFYDASISMDSVSCELDNGGCSQLCMVDGASHHCRCHFGYRLHQDGVTCISDQVSADFFLVTDTLSRQLLQIRSETNEVAAVPLQNGARPEQVAFNWVTGNIVWYDSEAAAIKMSSLDGSSVRVLRSLAEAGQPAPNTVGALCIDPSANTLFFTEIRADNSTGWIRVISLDTGVMRTLQEPATPPRFLAVASSQGRLVYGTDAGSVYLSDMAMETTSSLLTSGITKLSGLVFSDSGSAVQWSDETEDGLWRMPLGTLVEETRLHKSGSHPRSLFAWGDTLYYLTGTGRTINALSSSGIETTVVQFPEFGHLTTVHFFGQQSQAPKVSAVCRERNGRCSTLCLPTSSSGRQCQCADGVSLLEDKRTCSNVEKCPSEVTNGQLSTTCDNYPAETCDYTCHQGYLPNPSSTSVRCGTSGDWNVSTDSLCLRACARSVRNGQMSAGCPLLFGSSCEVACDPGFAVAETASPKVECGQDGEWSVSSDAMCQAIEEDAVTFPVYAVAAISVGAAAIVAVIIGCFLYRRMKRYGGRDSTRLPALERALTQHAPAHHQPTPALCVTSDLGEGAVGGKQMEEDACSEHYDELDKVEEEVERYQSFSKISPRPDRKFIGRPRSALPNGSRWNEGFDPAEEKGLTPHPTLAVPSHYEPAYSRFINRQPPPPSLHAQGPDGRNGDYLTPGRPQWNGKGDCLLPDQRLSPPPCGPRTHFPAEPTPDYMEVIPPSPRLENGAEFLPLRKMSRSDWTA